MAAKKAARMYSPELGAVKGTLEELYLALGRSVITLQQTQKALEKDATTLRVNATQLRDSIRGLQSRQRVLFAQLKEAGVTEE